MKHVKSKSSSEIKLQTSSEIDLEIEISSKNRRDSKLKNLKRNTRTITVAGTRDSIKEATKRLNKLIQNYEVPKLGRVAQFAIPDKLVFAIIFRILRIINYNYINIYI